MRLLIHRSNTRNSQPKKYKSFTNAEWEQQLYAQLSIFYESFSRQAAQGVTGISLRELLGLVGKSLLQRSEEERFETHNLLHYYASQKLLAQPDLHSRTSDQHSKYYCAPVAVCSERVVYDFFY